MNKCNDREIKDYLSILHSMHSDQFDHLYNEFSTTYENHRTEVANWIITISQYFNFHHITSHAAISLLDRLPITSQVSRDEFQILVVTCLLIAAKFLECERALPSLYQLEMTIHGNSNEDEDENTPKEAVLFTNDKMLNFELWVLKKISWKLNIRTPISYITVLSSFGFMLGNDSTPKIKELYKERERKSRQLKKINKELDSIVSSPAPSSSPLLSSNLSNLLLSPSSPYSDSDLTVSSPFSPSSSIKSSPNSISSPYSSTHLNYYKSNIIHTINEIDEEIHKLLESTSTEIYATAVNLCNSLIVESKYKKFLASKIASSVLLHSRRVHQVYPLWNDVLVMMMKHDPRDEEDIQNDLQYEGKFMTSNKTKSQEIDPDFVHLKKALHELLPVEIKMESLSSSSIHEDSFNISYEDDETDENSFINSNKSSPVKGVDNDVNDAINSLVKMSLKTPSKKFEKDFLSIKSPDNVIHSDKLEY